MLRNDIHQLPLLEVVQQQIQLLTVLSESSELGNKRRVEFAHDSDFVVDVANLFAVNQLLLRNHLHCVALLLSFYLGLKCL